MTSQHPITPPPELMQRWREQAPRYRDGGVGREDWLMARAAQWGADQELEACCEWLVSEGRFKYEHEAVEDLRAARRPKPQTLNSIAMQMLGTIERDGHYIPEITDTIRLALEALPDG